MPDTWKSVTGSYQNASGGKVTVDDLSVERKVTGWYINSEKIMGLPSAIASAINGADSMDKYYDYKQMLHSILNYKQEHGEIPQYHMDFQWNGKGLEYVARKESSNRTDCCFFHTQNTVFHTLTSRIYCKDTI